MDINKLPILRPNDPLLFQDTSTMPSAGRVTPCLMCGKPFIMPKYVGMPDQVCPMCQKDYDEMARLVCNICKVTIGRIVPGIIDCGYYVQPRAVLHVNACNICMGRMARSPNSLGNPGVSTVIEIAQWEKLFRPKKTIILPSTVTSNRR